MLRPVLIRMLDGRVGSTLVMQLLGTSPEVFFDRAYPFEHSYLTYFLRLAGVIGVEGDQERSSTELMQAFVYGNPAIVSGLPFHTRELDRAALKRATLTGVWQAFSDVAREATTPSPRLYAEKFWGDLTPVIEAGLEPIVIDLVRDPRDILCSIRAFRDKLGRDVFERSPSEGARQQLARSVAGMRFRLASFAEQLPVPQILLRYEDLVGDLPLQAARLGDLLEVELDPGAAAQLTAEAARHMTSSTVKSSVGRWREDLSAADIQFIESQLGDRMVELGYPPSQGCYAGK